MRRVINMDKIKKFLSDNKEEMKVLAYGVVMMTFGIHVGIKLQRFGMDKLAVQLAESGKTAYKIIDNEMYEMTVIKGQLK
jgi:hypothetical protein